MSDTLEYGEGKGDRELWLWAKSVFRPDASERLDSDTVWELARDPLRLKLSEKARFFDQFYKTLRVQGWSISSASIRKRKYVRGLRQKDDPLPLTFTDQKEKILGEVNRTDRQEPVSADKKDLTQVQSDLYVERKISIEVKGQDKMKGDDLETGMSLQKVSGPATEPTPGEEDLTLIKVPSLEEKNGSEQKQVEDIAKLHDQLGDTNVRMCSANIIDLSQLLTFTDQKEKILGELNRTDRQEPVSADKKDLTQVQSDLYVERKISIEVKGQDKMKGDDLETGMSLQKVSGSATEPTPGEEDLTLIKVPSLEEKNASEQKQVEDIAKLHDQLGDSNVRMCSANIIDLSQLLTFTDQKEKDKKDLTQVQSDLYVERKISVEVKGQDKMKGDDLETGMSLQKVSGPATEPTPGEEHFKVPSSKEKNGSEQKQVEVIAKLHDQLGDSNVRMCSANIIDLSQLLTFTDQKEKIPGGVNRTDRQEPVSADKKDLTQVQSDLYVERKISIEVKGQDKMKGDDLETGMSLQKVSGPATEPTPGEEDLTLIKVPSLEEKNGSEQKQVEDIAKLHDQLGDSNVRMCSANIIDLSQLLTFTDQKEKILGEMNRTDRQEPVSADKKDLTQVQSDLYVERKISVEVKGQDKMKGNDLETGMSLQKVSGPATEPTPGEEHFKVPSSKEKNGSEQIQVEDIAKLHDQLGDSNVRMCSANIIDLSQLLTFTDQKEKILGEVNSTDRQEPVSADKKDLTQVQSDLYVERKISIEVKGQDKMKGDDLETGMSLQKLSGPATEPTPGEEDLTLIKVQSLEEKNGSEEKQVEDTAKLHDELGDSNVRMCSANIIDLSDSDVVSSNEFSGEEFDDVSCFEAEPFPNIFISSSSQCPLKKHTPVADLTSHFNHSLFNKTKWTLKAISNKLCLAELTKDFTDWKTFLEFLIPQESDVDEERQHIYESSGLGETKRHDTVKRKVFLANLFPPLRVENEKITEHAAFTKPGDILPQFTYRTEGKKAIIKCVICEPYEAFLDDQQSQKVSKSKSKVFEGVQQLVEHGVSQFHASAVRYFLKSEIIRPTKQGQRQITLQDFYGGKRSGGKLSSVKCQGIHGKDIVEAFRNDKAIHRMSTKKLFRCARDNGHFQCFRKDGTHSACEKYKNWAKRHKRYYQELKRTTHAQAVYEENCSTVVLKGDKVVVNGTIRSCNPPCLGIASQIGPHPHMCDNCNKQQVYLKDLMKKRAGAKLNCKKTRLHQRGFNVRYMTKKEDEEYQQEVHTENDKLRKAQKNLLVRLNTHDWADKIVSDVKNSHLNKFILDVHRLFSTGTAERHPLQMTVMQNLVSQLLAKGSRPYLDILKSIGKMYKNIMGTTNYKLFEDIFKLPSATTVDNYEANYRLHLGFNEQSFEAVDQQYGRSPVVHCFDEGRVTRSVEARLDQNGKIELLGPSWDSEVKTWPECFRVPKIDKNKGDTDEYTALKRVVTEWAKTGKLATHVSIHNLFPLAKQPASPLIGLVWPTPNRGHKAADVIEVIQEVRRRCALYPDGIPRESPIPLFGHCYDSAPHQLSAAKTLATPTNSMHEKGVQYLGLDVPDQYLAPYFWQFPDIMYMDAEHERRTLLRCLKYNTRQLTFCKTLDGPVIATIDHLVKLKQVCHDTGIEDGLNDNDLKILKFMDQQPDAANRVFSKRVYTLLEERLKGAGGTTLYLITVNLLTEPFMQSDFGSPAEVQKSLSAGIHVLRCWKKYLEIRNIPLHAKPEAAKVRSRRGSFITRQAYVTAELLFSAGTNHNLALYLHYKENGKYWAAPWRSGTMCTEHIIGTIQGKTNQLQSLNAQPTVAEVAAKLTQTQYNVKVRGQLREQGVSVPVSSNRKKTANIFAGHKQNMDLTYEYPETYTEFLDQQREAHQDGKDIAKELLKKYLPSQFADVLRDANGLEMPYIFNEGTHIDIVKQCPPLLTYPIQIDMATDTVAMDKLKEKAAQFRAELEVEVADIPGEDADIQYIDEDPDEGDIMPAVKGKWYISHGEDKVHLNAALKEIIGTREYVSRERSKRHITSVHLSDFKPRDKDDDIIKYMDAAVMISGILRVVHILQLETDDGKCIMSTTKKTQAAFRGILYQSDSDMYRNRIAWPVSPVMCGWRSVKCILTEVHLLSIEDGFYQLHPDSLDLIEELGYDWINKRKKDDTEPEITSDLDSDEYEIDRILERRFNQNTHEEEYLVSWTGYQERDWISGAAFRSGTTFTSVSQYGRERMHYTNKTTDGHNQEIKRKHHSIKDEMDDEPKTKRKPNINRKRMLSSSSDSEDEQHIGKPDMDDEPKTKRKPNINRKRMLSSSSDSEDDQHIGKPGLPQLPALHTPRRSRKLVTVPKVSTTADLNSGSSDDDRHRMCYSESLQETNKEAGDARIVFAKWTDNHFYAATILSEGPNRTTLHFFDEIVPKDVYNSTIIWQTIPVGTVVYVRETTRNNTYRKSTIVAKMEAEYIVKDDDYISHRIAANCLMLRKQVGHRLLQSKDSERRKTNVTHCLARGNTVLLRYPPGITARNQAVLTEEDFDSLKGDNWLTGGILNFYFRFKLHKNMKRRVELFSVNGYQSLLELYNLTKKTSIRHNVYQQYIQRLKERPGCVISQNSNIWACDMLFIPCNNGDHWFLIAVFGLSKPEKLSLVVLDSRNRAPDIRGRGAFNKTVSKSYTTEVAAVKWFLEMEWERQRKDECRKNFGHCTVSRPAVPQQINNHDCGIFVMTFFDKILEENWRKLPDRCLESWFDTKVVEERSRLDIRRTLQPLIEAYQTLLK